MALFRLAYISKSELSRDPDTERGQIADILLTARRNNEEREITGALLASETMFAQVLEGERREIEATFRQIAKDPRHRHVVLLLTEPLDVRQFPQWSMAYVCASQSAADAVARVSANMPNSERTERTHKLLSFMSSMIGREAAAIPA